MKCRIYSSESYRSRLNPVIKKYQYINNGIGLEDKIVVFISVGKDLLHARLRTTFQRILFVHHLNMESKISDFKLKVKFFIFGNQIGSVWRYF